MLDGGCLCGDVRFRIKGKLGPAGFCHCKQCQRASGSAFASNAPARTAYFEITSGGDLVTEYESSPGKFRAFCRRCGSPVYSRRDSEPDVRRIRLGTLDSDPERRPLAHLWVSSKAPWYSIADSLPQYPEGVIAEELPDIGAVLLPLLQRVPRQQQPVLIALAERLAADRYRGWATHVAEADRRDGLMGCADREDEIARRVESLHSGAAAIQRDLLVGNRELLDINRSLFAGRSLAQQFVIQARAERLGASTWRAFAQGEKTAERRDTFLGCALLEEESAAYLDSIAGDA
ncbi:MAG TPA: GFA family protein [Candidatus Nitrosopolaris sp.]|nr:GFA family protein [Candidatus Nitrosopolaris sp.]